jgi:hypothetical protein
MTQRVVWGQLGQTAHRLLKIVGILYFVRFSSHLPIEPQFPDGRDPVGTE